MSDFFDGWVQSDAARRDSIDLKRIYVDINEGNFYDAVLFSQIMYWHEATKDGKQKLQVFRDGHWWLAKTYGDWYEECRINANTARKSIDRLKGRGLVITEIYHFAGKPMVHVRVDKAGFEKAVKQIEMSKVELMCPTVSDVNDTTGQMDVIPQDDCLYTETTTKIPTKTKNKKIASGDARSKPAKKKPAKKAQPYDDVPQPVRTEIIAAWVNSLEALPIENVYANRTNHTKAAEIHRAGYTAYDVARYVKQLQKDKFWKGKHIALTTICKNMPAWLKTHPDFVPAQPLTPAPKPDEQNYPVDLEAKKKWEELKVIYGIGGDSNVPAAS